MRSRGWCFTINNYDEDHMALMMDQESLGYRYIIAGFEVGEKGTPHIQGYIYFESQRWFDSVRKLLWYSHIEKQKGPFMDAVDYCKKDGDFYENGHIPSPGKVDAERIEEIMANPMANFHLYNQYRRSYDAVKNSEKKNHLRKLVLAKSSYKYEIATTYKDVSIYPSEYDKENVVIYTHCYILPDWLRDWAHGFPHKQVVGYERRFIDPEYVFILYDTLEEKNYLYKHYISEIYGVYKGLQKISEEKKI